MVELPEPEPEEIEAKISPPKKRGANPFTFSIADDIWTSKDRRSAVIEVCKVIRIGAAGAIVESELLGEPWNPSVYLAAVLSTEIYIDLPEGSLHTFETLCGVDCDTNKLWIVFSSLMNRVERLALKYIDEQSTEVPGGFKRGTIIGQWNPLGQLAEAFAEVIHWYLRPYGDLSGADLRIERPEDPFDGII